MLDHISCCTVVEPVKFIDHVNRPFVYIVWLDYLGCTSTMPTQHRCYAHHGSNSCMILSNRMTANNRAEKPDTHAKKRMANVMRLFHPAGLVSNDFILTLESAGSKQTRDRHTGELNPYANITGNCPSLP